MLIRFFTVLILVCTINIAHAGEFSKGVEVKQKAGVAVERLKTWHREGRDASEIVPMMQQVKVLGVAGKIDEANELLDRILLKFDEPASTSPVTETRLYDNPKKVRIIGYNSNAMEPFISRDGKYLFFNDKTKGNKDIFYATHIDDFTFKFMGEVKGINTNEVDGVPSMDKDNNFYYVSTGEYKAPKFNTLYRGKFQDGEVTNIIALDELSIRKSGWLNMDAEISKDGNTLYSTINYFSGKLFPDNSTFFIANKQKDGSFKEAKNSKAIFKNINTDNFLEYAASISSDGLKIFFTKGNIKTKQLSSFIATRSNKNAPFSKPEKLTAITGLSEAPAITDDEKLLYYHYLDGKYFSIYALTKIK